jgi:hypothetical protein
MAQEPHKPTGRLRKKVCLLVAAGMSEPEVATALKMARETLRKYYADELLNGRASFRRELLEMLETAARKGSVAAMKHLDLRTSGEAVSQPPLVGKKIEQAKAAATAGAGTVWAEIIQMPDGQVN